MVTAFIAFFCVSVPLVRASSCFSSETHGPACRGRSMLQTGETAIGSKSRLLQLAAQQPDPDAAARTLLALDANKDKRVDQAEVKAFAELQGLDSQKAVQAFSQLDEDGDGALNENELQTALDGGGLGAAMAGDAPEPGPMNEQQQIMAQQQQLQAAAAQINQGAMQQAGGAMPPGLAAGAGPQAMPALAAQPGADSVAVDNSLSSIDSILAKNKALLASSNPLAEQNAVPSVTDALAASGISGDASTAASALTATATTGSALSAVDELTSTAEVDVSAHDSALETVADQLAFARDQERKAELLEKTAQELRAKAAALALEGKEEAETVAAKATQAKVKEIMEKAAKLDGEEKQLTLQAASLKARAKVELDQANDYMHAADDALMNATHNKTAL